MKKKRLKRRLALVMALAIVTALSGFAMEADAKTIPSGSKAYLGMTKVAGYVHPHLGGDYYRFSLHIKGDSDYHTAYCIEPDEPNMTRYTPYTVKTLAQVMKSESRSKLLGFAMTLGYHRGSGKSVPYGKASDWYAATQVLVWQIVDGDIEIRNGTVTPCRDDIHYNLIKGHEDGVKNYEYMVKRINGLLSGPSFAGTSAKGASVYTMKHSFVSGKDRWSVTVTDKDAALVYKALAGTGKNLTMKRNGSKYTFTATASGSYTVTLAPSLAVPTSCGSNQPMLVAFHSDYQNLIYGSPQSVNGKYYVKLATEPAETQVKIHKRSNTGEVSGFRFVVSLVDGQSLIKKGEYTTGETEVQGEKVGLIELTLYPGTYEIQEVLTEDQKALKWEVLPPQRIKVTEDGRVMAEGEELQDSTITFVNSRSLTGDVTIVKATGDGGPRDGFTFRVSGWYGDNPEPDIITYVTTGEDGVLNIPDLTYGTYEIEEVMTDEQLKRYRQPESQQIVLSQDSPSATVEFENLPVEEPVSEKKNPPEETRSPEKKITTEKQEVSESPRTEEKSPVTGDSARPVGFLLALILSAAAICFGLFSRRSI